MRRPVITVCCAAALAGCGGTSSSTTLSCSTPTPDPASPSAAVGAVSASASRARVAGEGQSVTFTVTVRGPAQVDAPCAGPLRVVVVDRAGLHVFGDQPAEPPGMRCGDLRLDPGQTADFSVAWQPDTTLPPGTYDALLTLGDQPPLTIPILVGPPPACR